MKRREGRLTGMRKMTVDEMRVRNGVCQAYLDGEWVGVSILGEDALLNELPEIGDWIEAGSETIRVVL